MKKGRLKVLLYDNETQLSDIKCAYALANSNVELVSGNIITDIIKSTYPPSTDMVRSDGSYLFTNETDSDLYVYILFGNSDDGAFPVNGKSATIIM